MPGVPSGRGCEGCRKQKKKCDEARPSCSRCVRLSIICVGSGQKRYKFKAQQHFSNSSNKEQVTKINANSKKAHEFSALHYTPSNQSTLLACSFLDTIKVSTDLRYNLAWSYGMFLEMLPRRLGINEALDTSVMALTSAHKYFCTGQKNIVDPLIKYSRAVRTLRVSLDDPIQACSSEILCSVYLLLICQGLLGASESHWTGHGEGAVQILKARGSYKPQDDFERQLLLSIRGPVLFEGLFNPKMQMSSWEWKTLVENEFDGVSYEGQMMRYLARYPNIMQRGRYICKGMNGYLELLEELRAHHCKLKVILAALHERLAATEGLFASGVTQSAADVWIHCHYQRSYGVCLIICIISNCVLNAVDVEDTQLVFELTYLAQEILALSKSAAVYRPLGASYMELCLIAVWVGTTDCSIRKMAEKEMAGYERGFLHGQAQLSRTKLERISRQLRLLDPDAC